MKLNDKDLSVVIPIYNEEKIIPELFRRLSDSARKITENYELISINDGSSDGSLNQLQSLAESQSNVFFINFSRNFGHQIAVSAGLDAALGKAVVIMDGDLLTFCPGSNRIRMDFHHHQFDVPGWRSAHVNWHHRGIHQRINRNIINRPLYIVESTNLDRNELPA